MPRRAESMKYYQTCFPFTSRTYANSRNFTECRPLDANQFFEDGFDEKTLDLSMACLKKDPSYSDGLPKFETAWASAAAFFPPWNRLVLHDLSGSQKPAAGA